MRGSPAAALARSAMRLVSWRMSRQAPSAGPGTPGTLASTARSARSILVVALAEVGDMVLLSPFLRELRRGAPSARISLVCLPASAVLYEESDDVDEVIAYHAAMHRLLRPLLLPARARAFARGRLAGGYDLAIVPRWDTDHHLATAVTLFSGAARRLGHSEQGNPRRAILNAGFDSLLTDVVRSDGVAHEVERHLAMLRALGMEARFDTLELSLTEGDRARAARELSELPAERPLVALGIGAAHPKRRWPVSRFAELGRALQDEHGVHLVIVGGPDDGAMQDELLRALSPHASGLAGRLTLRETAAVLERSSLFVGNDSAPLHLAVAGRVACVEISCHPAGGDPLHNNAPERFRPWRVPAAVIRPHAPVPPCSTSCAASDAHCILRVTASMVLDAVVQLRRDLAVADRR